MPQLDVEDDRYRKVDPFQEGRFMSVRKRGLQIMDDGERAFQQVRALTELCL